MEKELSCCYFAAIVCLGAGWSVGCSVTRLGDLLDFEQLFKAFGNN